MTTIPLVIVTPQLAPRSCGLGAYAWELDRHWPDQNSVNRFLVLRDAALSREHLGVSKIDAFPASAQGLADTLEGAQTDDVLLHYAGRAYHRFGFPRWMPKAFARWRGGSSRRRLHVIFHELPADLPLLSKQGILQRLSFPVARDLAEQASTVITNSEHHASVLRRWRLRSAVHWFPVPSNIPPPEIAPVEQKRPGRFVIFGLPYTRLLACRLFREFFAEWRREGRMTQLHLIGPRDQKFSPEATQILAQTLSTADVVDRGELSAAEVSRELLSAEFCLSSSDEKTWSKSGTFMAYAAHGCAVITPVAAAIEPLCYATGARDLIAAPRALLREKSEQLRRWYFAHADWSHAAHRIAELIGRQ